MLAPIGSHPREKFARKKSIMMPVAAVAIAVGTSAVTLPLSLRLCPNPKNYTDCRYPRKGAYCLFLALNRSADRAAGCLLYGACQEVSARQRMFLSLHLFLCSISSPFLRPDPRFAEAGARRSCQGWPSRQPCDMICLCQAIPLQLRARRPRLTRSGTIRGEPASIGGDL
jgi:hypothetical protein